MHLTFTDLITEFSQLGLEDKFIPVHALDIENAIKDRTQDSLQHPVPSFGAAPLIDDKKDK